MLLSLSNEFPSEADYAILEPHVASGLELAPRLDLLLLNMWRF
jgi:hypothetical protein